jgi:protein BCP1
MKEMDDDDMEIEEAIDLSKLADLKKLRQEENTMDEEKDEDWEEDDGALNVDFVFYDPDPNQFFSVKNLINGLLDGLSYKSSQLADLITKQAIVGTMIGCEDDDENPKDRDIIAFASILNLGLYQKEDVIAEIIKFIVEKSAKHNINHENFTKILDSEYKNIGLLVNERVVNMSPKLTPVLHQEVGKDVNWIRAQNDSDAQYFNLKYLLGISKCFKDIKLSEKKKMKISAEADLKEYLYPKFEDHEFLVNADFSFMFEANTSKNASGTTNVEKEITDQQCYRMVYLIKWDKYISSVAGLDKLIEA